MICLAVNLSQIETCGNTPPSLGEETALPWAPRQSTPDNDYVYNATGGTGSKNGKGLQAMRITFSAALIALTVAVLNAPTASAQGTYSGKTVYGLFGPRVLGETLQSPVQRQQPQRGIARDPYGDFVGRNPSYAGSRFPEARARASEAPPAPIPPPRELNPPAEFPSEMPSLPEPTPESAPLPDEWLRSPRSQFDVVPPSQPAEPDSTDSSWLRLPNGSADAGWAARTAGYSPSLPAMDPFSARIASMLQHTVQIKTRTPIRVDVVGETAVLRGRVATKQDRELAENLVRLEPGVWDVKNLLIAEDAARVATIRVRPTGD